MHRTPLYFCLTCRQYTFHPDTVAPLCPLCAVGYPVPISYQRATKNGRYRLYYCPACMTLHRMNKRTPLPLCPCGSVITIPLNLPRYLLCTKALSKTASPDLRASLFRR